MSDRVVAGASSAHRAGAGGDAAAPFEQYRVELTAYCYRMLGSAFETEDAVQETLLRAWRKVEGFQGRAALRTWLYRIASNVCLNMLKGAQRRARPMDLTSPGSAGDPLGDVLPEATWLLPIPDGEVVPAYGDPADIVAGRESLRLAFVAALQHLPPRQRLHRGEVCVQEFPRVAHHRSARIVLQGGAEAGGHHGHVPPLDRCVQAEDDKARLARLPQ